MIKDAKTFRWGKQPPKQPVLGHPHEGMKWPLLLSTHRAHLEWSTDLHKRATTRKLSERRSKALNVCVLQLDGGFLDMTPEAQSTKGKTKRNEK